MGDIMDSSWFNAELTIELLLPLFVKVWTDDQNTANLSD